MVQLSRSEPAPLGEAEERAWRALLRVIILLPRALADDLERLDGLPLTDYAALMHLSEAPQQSLRMAELAQRMAMSPSRITRVIIDLEQSGWVERRRDTVDGRGQIAVLTTSGLARLRRAWPHHLDSVRARFVDLVRPEDVAAVADSLEAVCAALRAGCSRPAR